MLLASCRRRPISQRASRKSRPLRRRGIRASRVDGAAFFAHLGRHLPEKQALGALGSLHTGDLYLAFACAMHDPLAMAELERQVLPPILPAVARVASEAGQVDDVMQSLKTKLLTQDGTDEPKILQYSGKGPLGAWLRVRRGAYGAEPAPQARRRASHR